MANIIQLKRGTGANSSSTEPAIGEPVFDTGTGKLYISTDGNTALSAMTAINAGTASSLAADNLTTGDAAITLATTTGNITIDAQAGDADIIFKGTDSSSDITALTLDMSEAGAATFNDKITAVGTSVFTNLDISGDVDIDGATNLDAVDIDGAVQLDNTLTIGANDQGYDVILYGDTASANLTWDTSADDLIFNGAARAVIPDGQLVLGSTAVGATAAEINAACDASARTAGAVAVADDHFLFADGGATGATKVESIADLATAMAGDGLSATSGAFAVSVDDSSIETNGDALRVKASGITNAMLGGSIANSKLTNSSITVSDGSNTTAVALGGTMTFSGTNNEVDVSESSGTITIGLPNNVTIGGNLTVSGTTTTVDSTTVAIADSMLKLAKDQANDADALDFGVYGQYGVGGTHKYAGIFRDVSATGDPFVFFDSLQAEPTGTVNTSGTGYDLADISAGAITSADGFTGDLTGDVTGNADTATNLTASTSTAVALGTIELGHATDTTIARSSAGVVTIQGAEVRTGTVAVAKGGTGATSASAARTALGVDAAGTDNSTNVTLVTSSHDYLSLSSQAITLGAIDLTADVSGVLPSANMDSDTAHLTTTQTFSGAKTFTANATFGADNTGVDVIFYGDTSGKRMTWDQSADNLVFTGGASVDGLTLDGGSF